MFKSRSVIIAAAGLFLLVWVIFQLSRETVPSQPEAAPQTERTTPARQPAQATVSDTDTAATITQIRPITNILARLVIGESLPVTLEQLASYLEKNHRDAGSLLAAFQATHDRALLDEAMSKYPNDPRVAYTAWFRTSPGPDDPEGIKARRQALETLKNAAPENALANYLSAANYFKSGQPKLAIEEMQTGTAKVGFNDYTQDAIQSMTEAYMAAGYSEAESKAAACSGALLPHLAELKQDGLQMVALAKSYQQDGDAASAQNMLEVCQDLGRRLNDPNSMTLIQSLVGVAIQRMALDTAVGISTDVETTQGLQDQLKALAQRREQIKSLSTQASDAWLQSATTEDIVAYYDRERIFGAESALQWLANRISPSAR